MIEENKFNLKKFLYGKIHRKLFLWFTVIAIVPLLSVGIISFNVISSNFVDAVLERSVWATSLYSKEVFLTLECFNKDVVLLSNLLSLKGVISSNTGGLWNGLTYGQWIDHLAYDFENLLKSDDDYAQVRYIDENGVELVRVDFDGYFVRRISKDKLQKKIDRYYFSEAVKLSKSDIYISNLDLNREGVPPVIDWPHNPTIRYATPVFDAKGNNKGIVILNVFADSFLDYLGEKEDQGRRVLLIDENGFYLKHDQKSKEWGGVRDLNTGENFKKDYPSIAPQILSGKSGVVIDDDNIVSYYPIFPNVDDKGHFWVVLRIEPVNIALLSVQTLKRNMAIVIFVFLGLVAVLILLVSRSISGPIVKLNKAADVIANGNFDYEVDIKTGDEIEQLGEAFNKMTLNLKKYMQTSKDSKTSLEEEVVRRTKESVESAEKLKGNIKSLEKANKIMVGRELDMIALKMENKKLKEKIEEITPNS